jgi:ferredoxin-NADP reductase
MAGAAVLGRLNWLAATVVSKRDETPRVRSIVFECPMWEGHMSGQHIDIRLTAEDGYQAQRSYSIASAPEDDHLVLTIERLQDGEVSPYLFDVLEPGDQLEMRGPIGRYFVWEGHMGGPLLLIAGGSGMVPFRAMLRHRDAVHTDVPTRLLYSARTRDDVVYRRELAAFEGVDVRLALTREQPEGWGGYSRRIDAAILAEATWGVEDRPLSYVCGPTGFVEAVANCLVDLGHEPESIKTERFGPTR